MDRKIFICKCHSLEHQVTFWYDEEDKELYLEVHLTNKRFFSRVKSAFKYIFGYKSRFGDWDEFLFKDEDLVKLKEYLNQLGD